VAQQRRQDVCRGGKAALHPAGRIRSATGPSHWLAHSQRVTWRKEYYRNQQTQNAHLNERTHIFCGTKLGCAPRPASYRPAKRGKPSRAGLEANPDAPLPAYRLWQVPYVCMTSGDMPPRAPELACSAPPKSSKQPGLRVRREPAATTARRRAATSPPDLTAGRPVSNQRNRRLLPRTPGPARTMTAWLVGVQAHP
jgi:hypothetical protein